MTLLVLGAGAEDAEDELGALLQQLSNGGEEVVGLDLAVNAYTSLNGNPAEAVHWLRAVYAPALVLVVDPPESSAYGPEIPVPIAVRTTRPAALAALRAWGCESPGSRDDLAGDAAHLLAALDDASPHHQDRLIVKDRAPRVSVITAVFNQERYLHATLSSLLADVHDDYEVVVVDDGSTDASPSIIDQYRGDERLVVATQDNVGGTGRMDLVWNHGLRRARGDLIGFLGGDDVSLPHRLTAQVAAFDEDPDLGVCHSAMHTIDPAGNRFGPGFGLVSAYDDLTFLRQMQSSNLVAHPSAMVSRRAFEQVGVFEEGLACDYHWWMKAAGRVRFRYLPQRLVEYRIHDRSLSTTAEGSERCAREAYRHRRIVVQRRTLSDFFPELVGNQDQQVWQDAGLSLGNALIHTDPLLALHAYEMADEHLRDHRSNYNRAVALQILGDRRGAVRLLQGAVDHSSRAKGLLEAFGDSATASVELYEPTPRLEVALQAGRAAHGEGRRRWDGSPVSVRSAYVTLDARREALNEQTLVSWSRLTSPESRLRWVYPDLGQGLDDALQRLSRAAVHAHDLTRAADIAIAEIDDFVLLPPDPERPTGQLSAIDDHRLFSEWAAAHA